MATCTSNYKLFTFEKGNRDIDTSKHNVIKKILTEQGFRKSMPIVCIRGKNKKLIVKDGQHRLRIAEELGIKVWYSVEDTDFDTAEMNNSQVPWTPIDYAKKWADLGHNDYVIGIKFFRAWNLPITKAFQILCGEKNSRDANRSQDFRSGKFKIHDYEKANEIASLYTSMVAMSSNLKTARFLEAIMCISSLDGFDPARLLHKSKLQRNLLVSYSTREAFVDMIENVYNYKAQKLVPLAIMVRQSMQNKGAK